ncbi:triose-phosphate isomerase [Halobacteriales archaeon QS_8_69_26]|nr:MAG: triose-phosphate isomerase [Halobacteriales archaeon QS_8_69_26]
MNLEYPLFLINYKLYEGTVGEEGLAYARTVQRVMEDAGARFALAPGTPDLRLVAENADVPVVAQAVDPVETGRGTGAVLPEAVREAGAEAVLVDHPEHRETLDGVERVIDRCRAVGLDTIVCADGVEAARAVLAFDPDCLLFENPADVATGRAITRTHPERVESVVESVAAENPRTKVLVGGGITDPEDVARGFELGADAAGAASAALGADDREAWLRGIAGAMPP